MTKRSRTMLVAGLLLMVLFGDILVSKAVFYSVCLKQSTQLVSGTQSGVEGFLLTGRREIGCAALCNELLGKKNYKFVEVQVTVPRPEALASAPGLHRFYLAKAGDPLCASYQRLVDKSPSLPASYEKRWGIPGSMCIAGTAVDAPKSTYQYQHAYEVRYVDSLGITRIVETLSNRQSGYVLATSTWFARANGWIALGLRSSPPEVCQRFDGFLIDKIETILKPA